MKESGEFINARFGSRFTFSLLNQNIKLTPGKYVFMIDPLWNTTVENDDMYREVLIDIYGPEVVDIDQVEDSKGMEYLAKAFKHAANTMNLEVQYYLEENEEYGRNVTRISDVEALNCWYGFIYTKNSSQYAMTETMRPNLIGLEVAYPEVVEDQDINFTIQPGEDHIVILRRTENSCQYGLQYMTHPRPLSDNEMMEAARNMDDYEANAFGESEAFFKLFKFS